MTSSIWLYDDACTARTSASADSGWEAAVNPVGNVAGAVDQVISTDTLVVAGRTVHLAGIRGTNGPIVDGLRRWFASQGNHLTCTAAGAHYISATPNGRDIGPVILGVGAGQAAEDAPPSYRSIEAQARAAGRGVWAPQH